MLTLACLGEILKHIFSTPSMQLAGTTYPPCPPLGPPHGPRRCNLESLHVLSRSSPASPLRGHKRGTERARWD